MNVIPTIKLHDGQEPPLRELELLLTLEKKVKDLEERVETLEAAKDTTTP